MDCTYNYNERLLIKYSLTTFDSWRREPIVIIHVIKINNTDHVSAIQRHIKESLLSEHTKY